MKFYTIVLFFLCDLNGQAQSSAVSAGGNASGPGGTSSFSVGQVVYTEITGPGGTINQGVQQTYEITTSIGEDFDFIQLGMVAYPNPTSGHLMLKIEDTSFPEFRDLRYQLTDVQGKNLYSDKVVNAQTSIPVENLSSATYLLHVYHQNSIIKSFKIIKN